jgi:hypothetical protein
MANANVTKANGAGSIMGDLSPEDAEKFAAAFKPMWEFDDAPFAPTAPSINASEVRQLANVSPDADLMAAMHMPMSAPAKQQAKRPPQGRPPGPRAAAAVPQRATGRDASVDLDLPPLKSSNKPLIIGLAAAVAGVALFFGVRAALSGPEAPPATPAATASPPSHEEPKIPPPPPVTAAAADPPKADPVKADPPKVDPPKADPPKPPPPVQVAAPAPPPPPRAAAPHYSPPPAPRPPPAAPKKSGSGIVRDNPF